MTYQAVFGQGDDGWFTGHVPEIPGAVGMGPTLDEARKSLEKSVTVWIRDAVASGEEIPKPALTITAPISIEAA